MSRLRQQIVRMSLADETSPEVPMIEEGPDSLEAHLADVVSCDQEVADADSALEDLGEVQASLESIALSVESAIADGGFTPREAELFRHAMDASAHRVGFKDNLPAIESFGGSSDRERATRIALEGVKETLQRVWQAIVNTLTHWWKVVEKFFYKVFNAAPRLMKRADALKAAASSHKEEMNEGAKLKADGLHAELLGGNAVEAANTLKSVAEDIVKEYATHITEYGEKIATWLKGVSVESQESFDKTAYEVGNIAYPVPAACSVQANPSEYGAQGLHKVKTTKPLPGGKVLVCVFADSAHKYQDEAGIKAYLGALASSRSFMGAAHGHTEAKEGEHAPLNKEAIVQVAEAVSVVASLVDRYQRTWDAQRKVKNALKEAGDEYSKKDSSKLEGASGSLAVELPKLVGSVGKEVDGAQRAFIGYAISTGAALVQLGEKSLKLHAGKKAEAPKAPAAAPAAAGATA